MAPRKLLCALSAAVALAAVPAPAQAIVTPGVMTYTEGAQCTANFLFTDGTSTYVGQSAHCATTSGATTTNGCEATSHPIGTPVEVRGASQPGVLAYSSWLAMRAAGETDDETCRYNDFALVRLSPADAAAADPTVPRFGGPTGVGTAETGEALASYQNSSLRLGIPLLSPKNGIAVLRSPGGWSTTVYTVTPGIPGDSGSGYLNASGQAIGTLSTLAVLPLPLSNGVGDLGRELAYARAHGIPGLQLVDGRRAFRPSLLGLT
ncbi:serine protease [Conexibacter sp. SYSU D00693]|uniref:serine protease n=1 Tax=Conexibacter sp. SYSU D00693 TaxID=2812560 RepID=UPI00196A85A3|nr:serine protease [Conexibacter sp. SYSU D00693]